MSKNIYRTSNLNIMAYAREHNLRYIRSEMDYSGKPKVVALFEDPDNEGPELEMQWHESKEKRFQDYRTYFRNEIDSTLKRQHGK
jgi:hypothetical protein